MVSPVVKLKPMRKQIVCFTVQGSFCVYLIIDFAVSVFFSLKAQVTDRKV